MLGSSGGVVGSLSYLMCVSVTCFYKIKNFTIHENGSGLKASYKVMFHVIADWQVCTGQK